MVVVRQGAAATPALRRVRLEPVVVVRVGVGVLGRRQVLRDVAGRRRRDEDAVDGEPVTRAQEVEQRCAEHVHEQHGEHDAEQRVARLDEQRRGGGQHRLQVLRHAALEHAGLVTCKQASPPVSFCFEIGCTRRHE